MLRMRNEGKLQNQLLYFFIYQLVYLFIFPAGYLLEWSHQSPPASYSSPTNIFYILQLAQPIQGFVDRFYLTRPRINPNSEALLASLQLTMGSRAQLVPINLTGSTKQASKLGPNESDKNCTSSKTDYEKRNPE